MAPTFEALLVPSAYRGDFARLSIELAPGLFAFCTFSSMWNPVFQLARRTWPSTFAACAALATDLVLIRTPFFSSGVDGLAMAHSLSLMLGSVVAAALALRTQAVRPSGSDVAAILIGTVAMAAAVRPLNAIRPAPLAAAAAILVGGSIIAATVLVFDIAGLRATFFQRLRELRMRMAAAG